MIGIRSATAQGVECMCMSTPGEMARCFQDSKRVKVREIAENEMNHRVICVTTVVAVLIVCPGLAGTGRSESRNDQQLVIAAFELDVNKVEALLKSGANPNARLGFYDGHLFENKWTLGYSPIGSDKWTPLLAVASSYRAPQPEKPAENTIKGLEASWRDLQAIEPKLIEDRNSRRMVIAKLLIDAKADLDLDDGYGATALAEAVYNNYENLALLLIRSGAKINTKTGVYIDGTGDITPLHRATSNAAILKAMLDRGADVNARATDGDTPLHWAARDNNVESAKLLLKAGADPRIKNEGGREPAYWCRTFDGISMPGDAEKREIMKLLESRD